jgi:cell division protein FtsQ
LSKGVKIALWAFAILLLAFIIGFVSIKKGNAVCKNILIQIKDTSMLDLIDKGEITALIESAGEEVVDRPVSEINIANIENTLKKYHSVKHAEVYMNIGGELVAEIVPRYPVVRICNRYNQHFLIDKEGFIMKASVNHPVRLIVANGNISHRPRFDTTINIYTKAFDKRTDIQTLREIHTLAGYVITQPFWNAQIQQIYINHEDDMELITLVGHQLVQFGKIDDYKVKLRNLEVFYKKGLPASGWETYKAISVKYKNQVICTRYD